SKTGSEQEVLANEGDLAAPDLGASRQFRRIAERMRNLSPIVQDNKAEVQRNKQSSDGQDGPVDAAPPAETIEAGDGNRYRQQSQRRLRTGHPGEANCGNAKDAIEQRTRSQRLEEKQDRGDGTDRTCDVLVEVESAPIANQL